MADAPAPPPSSPLFKLRGFKITSSNYALANQELRYRLVYDESELVYLYGELSLFNKRFDEDDWSLSYELKIFDIFNAQIGTAKKQITVSKDINILYVREGWGGEAWWKKGAYRFEGWIDGVKIAEATVHVVKEPFSDPAKNPYFEIESLRLYDGGYDNVAAGSRKYLRQLHRKDARYLWTELVARNTRKSDESWPCQLFFNYFYDTGELKGAVERFITVKPGDTHIKTDAGWGSPSGIWHKDNYRLEVVFMDQLIAVMPFSAGDTEVEDSVGWTGGRPVTQVIAPQKTDTLQSVMAELESLIGLSAIKTRVHEVTQYLKFLELRQEKGMTDATRTDVHAVFTGNPGTGKTTVARLLGRIYHQLGMLSKGHIVEVDRADLVGRYIGQTAPLVKEAITKARGGVLFIDEAYALARQADDTKDFGREVIEILLKELSDGPGDLAVFVAGYPAPMQTFLDSNPGLRSRFVTHFEFPDYAPEELLQIADRSATKRGVSFSPAARAMLEKTLIDGYRKRDESFSNARFVGGVVDEAKLGLGVRLMKQGDVQHMSAAMLSTIEEADVARVLAPRTKQVAEIPIQEDDLRLAIAELRTLVGLAEIKHEIDDLVKLVRFYRDTNKPLHKTFSLHSVFTGNPGTGKTTVARIVARIYKALGLLERGHLVEVDRQGLVAGFVGQTAEKTAKLMGKANGGILFIDEAYALVGSGHDFGHEAVEVILKRMEDARGELAVIVAGYTQQMARFLDTNPGLKSRFDRTFHFPDYTPIELYEITMALLKAEGVTPDLEAGRHLLRHWQAFGGKPNESFGNARDVRRLVESAMKTQHLRLADLSKAERTPEIVATLALADVKQFSLTAPGPQKGNIGFGAV